LNGDEGEAQRVQKASQLKWDRKRKRFVKGDGIGSNNEKMIRSESGALLPASFKSGRFDDWKKRNKNGSTVPTSSTHRHSRTAGASRSSGRELATAETILKDRRDKLNVSGCDETS
jgi:ATP-dependent RNA helicase DDX54/DBP10